MKNYLRSLKRYVKSLTQTREEKRHELVGAGHLWKMKREFQIQFLKAMNLLPSHYLLDIGCGTLRGGIPLISYLQKCHYYGVDARETVLDEARKELQEADLEEKNPMLLFASDISSLVIDQKFDYVWAFSVLIHMNDKTLASTLNFVKTHLQEKGAFYANVNIGSRKEGNWQGFPVVARSLDFYIGECEKNNLEVSTIGTLKEYGHVSSIASQDNQVILKITKKIA